MLLTWMMFITFSWRRFGELSLSRLLEGVELCCHDEGGCLYARNGWKVGEFSVWSTAVMREEGSSSDQCDPWGSKRFVLVFPEGKSLLGGGLFGCRTAQSGSGFYLLDFKKCFGN